MAGVFVIGTGRSGTSLLMQSLGRLGVRLPDDAVPATEDNLRGTGESIALRDQMVALQQAWDMRLGFRPDDLFETEAAQRTLDWATGYLTDQAAANPKEDFAVKLPLTSVFLPLWQLASERSGVALTYLWATRPAPQVLRSLQHTYKSSPEVAQRIWLQRTYYLLRDAPSDTLLVPFEGWVSDPQGQVNALARQIGVTDPARIAAAGDAFSSLLDHSSAIEVADETCDFGHISGQVDDLICRQLGPLSDRIDRKDTVYLRLMTRLSDTIGAHKNVVNHVISAAQNEMRLALLTALSETSDAETFEMKEEIEILSQRIRSVTQRNKELEKVASAQPPTTKGAQVDKQVLLDSKTAREETAAVKASYLALQQSYDKLEQTILHRYRQQIEARITEADRHKQAADGMRHRVKKAKEVQERHLAEREKSKKTIEDLRAELKKRSNVKPVLRNEANAKPDQTKARIEKQNNLISGQRKALAALRQQLEAAQADISAMKSSRSWRITAPLRRARAPNAVQVASSKPANKKT